MNLSTLKVIIITMSVSLCFGANARNLRRAVVQLKDSQEQQDFKIDSQEVKIEEIAIKMAKLEELVEKLSEKPEAPSWKEVFSKDATIDYPQNNEDCTSNCIYVKPVTGRYPIVSLVLSRKLISNQSVKLKMQCDYRMVFSDSANNDLHIMNSAYQGNSFLSFHPKDVAFGGLSRSLMTLTRTETFTYDALNPIIQFQANSNGTVSLSFRSRVLLTSKDGREKPVNPSDVETQLKRSLYNMFLVNGTSKIKLQERCSE